MKVIFDKGTALEAPHLWIELWTDPPTDELIEKHPTMFKRDDGFLMLDLTAYICLMHDIRRL